MHELLSAHLMDGSRAGRRKCRRRCTNAGHWHSCTAYLISAAYAQKGPRESGGDTQLLRHGTGGNRSSRFWGTGCSLLRCGYLVTECHTRLSDTLLLLGTCTG